MLKGSTAAQVTPTARRLKQTSRCCATSFEPYPSRGEMRTAEVTLEDVTKIYGGDVVAVRSVSLDIPDGSSWQHTDARERDLNKKNRRRVIHKLLTPL